MIWVWATAYASRLCAAYSWAATCASLCPQCARDGHACSSNSRQKSTDHTHAQRPANAQSGQIRRNRKVEAELEQAGAEAVEEEPRKPRADQRTGNRQKNGLQ